MVNLIGALTEPSGLWESIINWIFSFVANYGWTIVIFTVLIKIVLSPLDFFIKYSTRKNTLIQKKLQPQINKLNQKYGNDKNALNIQTTALYKKEGYNVIGSCLIMLGNMALTLVIFISIFASLRGVSTYQQLYQYDQIKNAYTTAISQSANEEYAKEKVLETYKSNKTGWLWVANVWVKDGYADVMPSYDGLKNSVNTAKNEEYTKYFNEIDKTQYEAITKIVNDSHKGWNGYYILAILAGATSFLSQWVSERGNKLNTKNKKLNAVTADPTAGTMKFMKILLPVLMVIFVVTSTASFGVYIVVSSLVATLTSYIINLIVFKLTEKQEENIITELEKYQSKAEKKGYNVLPQTSKKGPVEYKSKLDGNMKFFNNQKKK